MSLAETRTRIGRWFRALGLDGCLFALGFALLLPVFLAPLCVTRLLPGLDLPFHLGIADMLSKTGAADSPYAPYYDGGLRVAPYAAHYMALVLLGKVMNLLTAHKLIVGLYVAAMPLSAASLLAACGRSRIPALLAFPLAYNLTLHYGFVSFALSLPVLMWLLARMVRHVEAGPDRMWRTWALTAALALALFLCHLQNFLFGLGAALAFAAFSAVPWRRRLLGAATVLPALAAASYWQLTASAAQGSSRTVGQIWDIIKRHRLGDLDGRTWSADLARRLTALPNHAMRAFTDMSEVTACELLLIVVAAYIVVAALAGPRTNASGQAEPRRPARWPPVLVAQAGALVAYLFLPHHLGELELMTFYPRFAVLVVLMALLLVPRRLLNVTGPLRWLLPVPALIVCALYGRQLVIHYRLYAAESADFLAVVEKTPPGGRALSLVFDRASRVMRIESAYVGMAGFYPALRPGPASMAPLWYCGMRHMPCTVKPPALDFPKPWTPRNFDPDKVVPLYDYFFVRSPPPNLDLFKNQKTNVELLAQKGTWFAYRRKPAPSVPATSLAAQRPAGGG